MYEARIRISDLNLQGFRKYLMNLAEILSAASLQAQSHWLPVYTWQT